MTAFIIFFDILIEFMFSLSAVYSNCSVK
jgi:hypothetical protein